MSNTMRVVLEGTPDQFQQLRDLQVAFSDVCNAIAPVVQSTRCWNRVALHHLVYRNMRERFPALGSQMICNAVYAVSRTARLVLQHPKSPWNVNRLGASPLPLLKFAPTAPVYFDRHTLSLRGSNLSMLTLDGRVRFALTLAPLAVARFHRDKLLEVVMTATANGFELIFQFAVAGAPPAIAKPSTERPMLDYIAVIPPESLPMAAPMHATAATAATTAPERDRT